MRFWPFKKRAGVKVGLVAPETMVKCYGRLEYVDETAPFGRYRCPTCGGDTFCGLTNSIWHYSGELLH